MTEPRHRAPAGGWNLSPASYVGRHTAHHPKHRGTWDEHDRRVWETADRTDGTPVLARNCGVCNPARGRYARREVAALPVRPRLRVVEGQAS